MSRAYRPRGTIIVFDGEFIAFTHGQKAYPDDLQRELEYERRSNIDENEHRAEEMLQVEDFLRRLGMRRRRAARACGPTCQKHPLGS